MARFREEKGFRGRPPREKDHVRPGEGGTVYEREYSEEEFLFLLAAEKYRLRMKLTFLHATDYLKVLLEMGYRRQACGPASESADTPTSSSPPK